MESLDMFQGRTNNTEEKMRRRANQGRPASGVGVNANPTTANNRKALQLITSSPLTIRNRGVFGKSETFFGRVFDIFVSVLAGKTV